MSSWYIFSALGFYPVNPGQPIYALVSPLFDRATIHLENGKSFTVEAVKKAASEQVAITNPSGKDAAGGARSSGQR
jgi:putative alpha-1,2-mannosidase